jgi:hypothetical protein
MSNYQTEYIDRYTLMCAAKTMCFLLYQMFEILHCSAIIIFASSYILDAVILNKQK